MIKYAKICLPAIALLTAGGVSAPLISKGINGNADFFSLFNWFASSSKITKKKEVDLKTLKSKEKRHLRGTTETVKIQLSEKEELIKSIVKTSLFATTPVLKNVFSIASSIFKAANENIPEKFNPCGN